MKSICNLLYDSFYIGTAVVITLHRKDYRGLTSLDGRVQPQHFVPSLAVVLYPGAENGPVHASKGQVVSGRGFVVQAHLRNSGETN